MILAFDTYYFDGKAKTICLAFAKWAALEPVKIYSEVIENTEPYRSGQFYRKELPCILHLLEGITWQGAEAMIVDGFVFLDDKNTHGLGGRLYDALRGKVPVIGVAKSHFATVHQNERELRRGNTTKPLYISAIGMDLDRATQNIRMMAGGNRIPYLLKFLDRMTREIAHL